MKIRPIAVEQNNQSGSVSYWQGRDHQSHADRNGVSLAPYVHALYYYLVRAKARRVLMIGAAGGTLATMLARRGVRVTMVDINPAAFAIARGFFHLPRRVICRIDDGARFLRRAKTRYDAIVLDAFADDKIPKMFWTASFSAAARKRLKNEGVFVANIIVKDDEDKTPDRFCRSLQGAFDCVRLLDTDGYVDRNALILAGAVEKARPPKLLKRPKSHIRYIAGELKGLKFRGLR